MSTTSRPVTEVPADAIPAPRAATDAGGGAPPSATGTRHAAPAPIHRTSPWFRALGYLVLIVFAVIYIYPFLIQIATSLKTDADATAHPLSLIPSTITTAAFRQLARQDYPRWLLNSTFITVCVTAGRVFFDSLAGYALARLKFRGRGAITNAILAVLAVPGVVLLIPKFLVLNQLHIWSTYRGMILPLVADAAGIFIMKQFFETIPVSVEEAARLDGAKPFRIFWSVVLPMARPALITLTILSFQGSWNELPHFLAANGNPKLYPLTQGVATLISGGFGQGNLFPLKLAAGLIMTIPVAIVFFAFQRYFVQNANAGAEKG